MLYNNSSITNDLKGITNGIYSTITIKRIEKVLCGKFEEILKANQSSHEVRMKLRRMKTDKEDREYLFEDFYYIKKIGSGQFSTVYLTVNSTNNLIFAMKSVSKEVVSKNKLKKFILQEKKILEEVKFPFCMKFYRTFKDKYRVYFLLEFVNGIELFDAMREIGIFTTDLAKFYTATLILTMEYMHSRKIVYRDLKPENILVDSKVSL